MRRLTTGLAIAGLLFLTTGCNSTDALTPQVDVGAGPVRSSPVTQSDLDTMSAYNQPVGMAQEAAEQRARFAPPADVGASSATSYSLGDYRDPAGTLEEQASRLARSQEVREPREQTVERAAPVQETPAVAVASPSAGGDDSIRFLPIIGAPVQSVTPLSKQLGAEARAQGLTIRSSSDPNSQHILKGYFSAMTDNGKTTVVYVWDVLDGSGARLHRIQGQDSVSGTAADPWAAVPESTMTAIATRTIDEYMSWRQSSRG